MYQTCLELMSNWQYPNAFALNHGRYVVGGASIMPSSANATPPKLSLGLQPLTGRDAPARDNSRFLDPADPEANSAGTGWNLTQCTMFCI